ncbi:MAG: hypothetical protein KBT33_05015 [Prevotellaceae bacterium]|nr:hypothetical protein [Candidatus Minthosoma equi]
MEINPTWQNAFRGELVQNLRRVSNDFTRQLLIIDIAKECIMYSCDMCLEYNRQGAYIGISNSVVDNITYNVCIAMNGLVHEFGESQRNEVMSRVRELMKDPRTYSVLQEEIDKYYGR